MNEVIDVIESAGLTEQQVLHAALQLDVLHPLEPYQLTLMGAVEEHCAQTLCLTDTDGVPFRHLAYNLYIGILIVQFRNPIKPAAVNILIRVLA